MLLFERAAVQTELPKFVRVVAWYRFVRYRGAMRFHDHRGMIPSRLRMVGSGLIGTLVRTKSSGVGKARHIIEVAVDVEAFLLCPAWLLVGWALWENAERDRDCFLGLPQNI